MKVNRKKLYKLYMQWVDKVSEDIDWKTSFSPEEIVNAISSIIEKNPKLIENESEIKQWCRIQGKLVS